MTIKVPHTTSHRRKVTQHKDSTKSNVIRIGYEFKGNLSKPVIEYFLKRIKPNHEIIWVKKEKCDFIVSGTHGSGWNTKTAKYIGFSAESFLPIVRNKKDTLYFLSFIPSMNLNYLHIPYFLCSPYLYKEPIDNNVHRPYLVAYCNSNPVQERETLFSLLLSKTNSQQCHSLGKCNGKTEIKTYVSSDWKSPDLIQSYTQYMFVFAMENKREKGYITEKIENAFYAGAIPIYWGAPDINEYFNPKAFINVSDFKTLEDCADAIINMSQSAKEEMLKEPTYANSDLTYLMYDKDPVNPLRDEYTKKISEFLAL